MGSAEFAREITHFTKSVKQCQAINFKHYAAVHEKHMKSQPKMDELVV
jgi:hypothetical protein